MKHLPPQAFLQGIAIPGLALKFAAAFENSAPIVVDAAEIAAAAMLAARAKRGGK